MPDHPNIRTGGAAYTPPVLDHSRGTALRLHHLTRWEKVYTMVWCKLHVCSLST
jgi:hypothetical protein